QTPPRKARAIGPDVVDHTLAEGVSPLGGGLPGAVARRGETAEQEVEGVVGGDDLAPAAYPRPVRQRVAGVNAVVAHAKHQVAPPGGRAQPLLRRQELIERGVYGRAVVERASREDRGD